MSATDHIKQYSAADIQRYLDGKMLPAEMHALEKAALDDPFLADAIEGMQQTLAQHDAALVDTHLQDLRRQVNERTRKESNKARVIAFRWWQAAAAAVVVLTGGIWAYNYFQQTNSPAASKEQLAIAKQEKTADSVTPPAPAYAPVIAASDSTIKISDSTVEAFVASNLKVDEPKGESFDYSGRRTAPVRAKDQPAAALENSWGNRQKANAAPTLAEAKQNFADVKTDSTKAMAATGKLSDNFNNQGKAYLNSLDKTYKSKPGDYEQIVIARTARDTTAQGFYTKPRELAMNRSRKELSERQAKKNPDALLSGFISGRVTDQANNPISNAVLRVEGEGNRDFFTDQKGQFKIPVSDSVVNVAVGVTGYYTQNLQLLNNTRDNNIALNQLGVKAPNPQLENIRIRGYSPTRGDDNESKEKASSANYPQLMTQDAQPEYGWLEYQQYLEKNKQVPPGTPEITGVVVVSFQVNKKGALSDFKIEQSLGKVYDDEAIRLIKAGPAWKLTKGRKAKATILVRF